MRAARPSASSRSRWPPARPWRSRALRRGPRPPRSARARGCETAASGAASASRASRPASSLRHHEQRTVRLACDCGRLRRATSSRLLAAGSSAGSWRRIACSRRFSSSLGSRPSSSASSLPRGAVGVQRLGLPARAVQGEHQLAAQPLPQRGARHERLELADELGVAARAPDRPRCAARGPSAASPRAARSPPARTTRTRGPPAPARATTPAPPAAWPPRSPGPRAARFSHELLEAGEVELLGLDAQHVARRVGGQPATLPAALRSRDT